MSIVANTSIMSFRFKQFYIEDSQCAMKVGTDGVLIGCWAEMEDVRGQRSDVRILDAGTGSGLIARMMMQRYPEAEVEGIDIDEAAVEQAKENGVRSFAARVQEWDPEYSYDLIVSNPPYFQNSLKNPDKGRELARHTDSLSYEELAMHSTRLLKEHGYLAIILPAEAEKEMREIAAHYSLYCTRVMRVYSKETKPARRVLLQFEKSEYRYTDIPTAEETLVLEDEKGGRSLQYQELAKDFYL
jgi:tRNA1Val (adenine37-N6)-methyltransferase